MLQMAAIRLRGGNDNMYVDVQVFGKFINNEGKVEEINGNWYNIIEEFVPTRGNGSDVWPISHIVNGPALSDVVLKQPLDF